MNTSFDIHQDIKQKLDQYIENNNVPNIIFYGNHGSGKKHVLYYFLNNLYRDVENKSEYIMNVNCAFGKGIQFIREDLKFFSKTNLFNDNSNKSITIFKSVILLNADKLTTDAQSALRRCIEIFSNSTRFFIVTKDKTHILNPIQSRFHTVYIPYPFIPKIKKYSNLYLYNKKNFYNTTSYNNNHKTVIKKYLTELQNNVNNDDNVDNVDNDDDDDNDNEIQNNNVIVCADMLYNKCITGLEIIDFLHTSSFLEDSIEKYKLLIKMDTYRTKVRNEYMFIYLLLCSIQFYNT